MSTRSKLLLGSLAAVLLLVLFFRGIDWVALGEALQRAHRGYLVGVVVATLLCYLARAWRWGYLLAPLVRVAFPRLFSATVVGFMTGLVVPRAGEVVRPYLVARHHALPTSGAFASIILERLVDLITVLLLFALYLYVLPAPAAQTHGPLLGVLKAAGAVTGVGALGVLGILLALHRWTSTAVALAERLLRPLPARFGAPLVHMLRAFVEGLGVLKASPAHLAAIFLQSLLVWMAIDLGLYWNNLAFGIDLPFHTTFLLVAFLTVGVAIPTPGMVGGFHAFYLMALSEVYGVDKSTAAAAAISSHALTNLPVLLLGLFYMLGGGGDGLSFSKVASMSETEGRS